LDVVCEEGEYGGGRMASFSLKDIEVLVEDVKDSGLLSWRFA
jgi:hypothetical protein